MISHDLVIIGGGPAGLAAAVSAKDSGVDDLLIIERDRELGGILNQCIHNGFGLHTFGEELTGPEYAARYIDQVHARGIPCLKNTMVVDFSVTDDERIVTAMNREEGIFQIRAGAVILAMGCRERPRGALNIPGYRPAGIYSAGTAQRLVNLEGLMPGREVVILGSGDIGLIMARRMTLEGAKVKVVAELMPYSGGLKRNIVQCLDDFGIPLKLSHTVIDIEGKERVSAVTIAQVGADGRPVPGTEERYTCDTLLLSCGLIPENELSRSAGIRLNPVTSGPFVSDALETSADGVFACGNVLHVHDLVDYVSQEAAAAGKNAARRLLNAGKTACTARSADGADAAHDPSSDLNAAGTARSADDADTAHDPASTPNAAGTARSADGADAAHRHGEGRPGRTRRVELVAADGVRYTVPSCLDPAGMDDTLTVRFRVDRIYRNHAIAVCYDEQPAARRRRPVMAPGEMEQVILRKEELARYPDLKRITIRIEEA